MALSRKLPKIDNPIIPRMYTGSLRVMAAVLLEALQQAGHKPIFRHLGTKQQGLCIGLAKESTLLVSRLPTDLTWSEAQACAKKINDIFKQALPAATGLARPVRGRLSPETTYVEVEVRCPKDRTLGALYLSLVKN